MIFKFPRSPRNVCGEFEKKEEKKTIARGWKKALTTYVAVLKNTGSDKICFTLFAAKSDSAF